DEDAVRRGGDNFADHVLHDLVIGVEQVVATHAWLARNAGGDDYNVGVRGIGVVVGAGDDRIALLDGHGFEQVERFALGHALHDVDQHHIGQLLAGDPVCGGRAHVSGTYDRDFL